MTKHRTDLVALLFGLTFASAGTIVLVTQATNVDLSPQWGAATVLIVLGLVALVATIVRAGTDRVTPAVPGPPGAPAATDAEDPAG